MNDGNNDQISLLLEELSYGDDSRDAVIQQMISRLRVAREIEQSAPGGFREQRIAQLWRSGLLQAGEIFDPWKLLSQIDQPPSWMTDRHVKNVRDSYIALIVPGILREALCYNLGVCVSMEGDERIVVTDQRVLATDLPYWMFVIPCTFNAQVGANFCPLSVYEGLLLHAQTDVMKRYDLCVLAGTYTLPILSNDVECVAALGYDSEHLTQFWIPREKQPDTFLRGCYW